MSSGVDVPPGQQVSHSLVSDCDSDFLVLRGKKKTTVRCRFSLESAKDFKRIRDEEAEQNTTFQNIQVVQLLSCKMFVNVADGKMLSA